MKLDPKAASQAPFFCLNRVPFLRSVACLHNADYNDLIKYMVLEWYLDDRIVFGVLTFIWPKWFLIAETICQLLIFSAPKKKVSNQSTCEVCCLHYGRVLLSPVLLPQPCPAQYLLHFERQMKMALVAVGTWIRLHYAWSSWGRHSHQVRIGGFQMIFNIFHTPISIGYI